jgi:phage/plasmid-like protein (TIGR03299 family)
MNHAIEQFTDGTAAFYSFRQPAWHQLGTVTQEAKTLAEALRIAQLDWRVVKDDRPVEFNPYPGVHIPVDGKFAVYRNHSKLGTQALGIVGKQYTTVQNDEIGELAETIVDESGGVWETMGSLDGGRKVFMSIKLPSTIDFSGEDTHELYLVLGSSHDGSMAVTAIITDIRVVCQNTWNAAVGEAKSRYVFRHTSGVGGRVQEAREALQLSFSYHREFEKQMEKWLMDSVTLPDVERIIRKVVPEHPLMTQVQFNRMEKTRNELLDVYMSPTQDFGRGSLYGVFNTFTEYDQWMRPVKGKDKDARRAATTLFDTQTKLASRAYALLAS